MEKPNEGRDVPAADIEGRAIPLICAWCDKIVGIIKSKVSEGENTHPTHGICPECFHKTMGSQTLSCCGSVNH
ncbi:MAG TPA: hypothetical protein DET40_01570 [Lentisphaeria bacterium]|nr:MAG: hypothetical protein A2X45_17150 [Lentisphaerae bacterium GWF2_50_93]HCE42222.1 hypothetical protein [Lentisphaeria bacterium]